MTEPITLARRNPEWNLYPFYRLSLAHTLFEEWSLVRHWGRLGHAGCATLEHDETWECAPKAPRRTLQATGTRGYQGRVAEAPLQEVPASRTKHAFLQRSSHMRAC